MTHTKNLKKLKMFLYIVGASTTMLAWEDKKFDIQSRELKTNYHLPLFQPTHFRYFCFFFTISISILISIFHFVSISRSVSIFWISRSISISTFWKILTRDQYQDQHDQYIEKYWKINILSHPCCLGLSVTMVLVIL